MSPVDVPRQRGVAEREPAARRRARGSPRAVDALAARVALVIGPQDLDLVDRPRCSIASAIRSPRSGRATARPLRRRSCRRPQRPVGRNASARRRKRSKSRRAASPDLGASATGGPASAAASPTLASSRLAHPRPAVDDLRRHLGMELHAEVRPDAEGWTPARLRAITAAPAAPRSCRHASANHGPGRHRVLVRERTSIQPISAVALRARAAEHDRQQLRAEADAQHRRARAPWSATSAPPGRSTRAPDDGHSSEPSSATRSASAVSGSRSPRSGRTISVASPALHGPVAEQAGRRVGLVLGDDERNERPC